MEDQPQTQQGLTPETTPKPVDPAGEVVEALPEWAQRLIKDIRKENGDMRGKLRHIERAQTEAEEKRQTEQGEFKGLFEKAKTELDALKAQLKATELDALRARIGAEYGLPSQLAARLQGDDEATMRSDAETLKSALPAPTPTPATGAVPRVPAGNPGEAAKATSQQMRDWLRGTAEGPFSQPGTLRLNMKSGGE